MVDTSTTLKKGLVKCKNEQIISERPIFNFGVYKNAIMESYKKRREPK